MDRYFWERRYNYFMIYDRTRGSHACAAKVYDGDLAQRLVDFLNGKADV